jgi:hypothetical protein
MIGYLKAINSSDMVRFYIPPNKISKRNTLDIEEEKVDDGQYRVKVKGTKVATIRFEDIFFYKQGEDVSEDLNTLEKLFNNRANIQYFEGTKATTDLIISEYDVLQERRNNNLIEIAKVSLTLKEL